MISNGFIINPYHELLPDYKICPFSTSDIHKNRLLAKSNEIDYYFSSRFNHERFYYTLNGRQAINIALSHYKVKPDDVITIFTTSGNFYISSCVTNEIEKFCKWSRKIENNTKIIFVNHEFGFPYKNIDDLKKYNLPIIEDCAHSFFSNDDKNLIGKIGEFVIYSFPKMFPIQIGGLLVANFKEQFSTPQILEKEYLQYVKNVLSHYIVSSEDIKNKRIENHNKLSNLLGSFEFEERFKVNDKNVPGVFLFKINNIKINLQLLKEYFYKQGIQCSVFYGENTFFIPCHQNLNENDFLYFKEIIMSYLKCLK